LRFSIQFSRWNQEASMNSLFPVMSGGSVCGLPGNPMNVVIRLCSGLSYIKWWSALICCVRNCFPLVDCPSILFCLHLSMLNPLPCRSRLRGLMFPRFYALMVYSDLVAKCTMKGPREQIFVLLYQEFKV
jgi:hypothetical protein